MINLGEILTVSIILFSIIDIVGSIPIVIDLKKKSGKIDSLKATLIAGAIMVAFLFVGEIILKIFGIDVQSFSVAGAIIILIIGMEMILDRSFFKNDKATPKTSSIVPLAFPLIAGAGSLTTILSLKAAYEEVNILVGIVLNLLLVFLVLKSSDWLESKIGEGGFNILRKVFGIILLSLAIKLFKENLFK